MDKETKDILKNINTTLKRIEMILLRIESKVESESPEKFYEKHGISQTFA